jgi:hypothetical protein
LSAFSCALGSLALTVTGGAVLQPLQAIGSVSLGFESEVPVEETIVFEAGPLEEVAEYSLEVSARGEGEGGETRKGRRGPVVGTIFEAKRGAVGKVFSELGGVVEAEEVGVSLLLLLKDSLILLLLRVGLGER